MPSKRVSRRAIDGIVLLDKPTGLTSNAALQQVKRIFRADKAGHTGSLDPLATGLLPICLGQATKLSVYLLDADKAYSARVRLGARTDTGDADGRIVAQSPVRASREALIARIPDFLGTIRQLPPMYSAIKIKGQPLYTLARAGIEVERTPREVIIHELQLTRFADDGFEFDVRCSKGTYVRTLAEDWARAAGEHAHLLALRRTAVGGFDSAAMVSLDQLMGLAGDWSALAGFVLPQLAALAHWPRIGVTDLQALRLRAGGEIEIDSAQPAGVLCVVDQAGGDLLWIAEHDGHGRLAPKRWLGRDKSGDKSDLAPNPEEGPKRESLE